MKENVAKKDVRGICNKNGMYKCNKDAMNDSERVLCTKCVVNCQKRQGKVSVNVRGAKNADILQWGQVGKSCESGGSDDDGN